MEETHYIDKTHGLTLFDRKKVKISGVYGILRFDEENVVLALFDGQLCLEGMSLVIEQFDKDSGEVEITGKIDSLYYTDKIEKPMRGGLFRRFGARESAT